MARNRRRTIDSDVIELTRRRDAKAPIAYADFKKPGSCRQQFAERGHAPPARFLARGIGLRYLARFSRSRVRTQHAPDRMRVLLPSEVIEIATLTARAGSNDISRNLRAGPDLGRKADRASS